MSRLGDPGRWVGGVFVPAQDTSNDGIGSGDGSAFAAMHTREDSIRAASAGRAVGEQIAGKLGLVFRHVCRTRCPRSQRQWQAECLTAARAAAVRTAAIAADPGPVWVALLAVGAPSDVVLRAEFMSAALMAIPGLAAVGEAVAPARNW